MSKHVLGSLHDIENINLTIFSRLNNKANFFSEEINSVASFLDKAKRFFLEAERYFLEHQKIFIPVLAVTAALVLVLLCCCCYCCCRKKKKKKVKEKVKLRPAKPSKFLNRIQPGKRVKQLVVRIS